MKKELFWQYKLVQFFHDPPNKPYASWPGLGGHRKVAKGLFKRFTKEALRYADVPDCASAGADRPLVDPKKSKGIAPIRVNWTTHPLITHPLDHGQFLNVGGAESGEQAGRREIKETVIADAIDVAELLGEELKDWGNVDQDRAAFFRIWRRFREELLDKTKNSSLNEALWSEMPSDSRCPDHSIWDHLKVVTALAFMDKNLSAAQQPWLLRFSIGPVGKFIQDSRTSRDLWISSFLLADLVWSAMEPLVEHYGPDCIVYPDLRGNPRVDVWLLGQDAEWLSSGANPASYASLLPNAFTALIPRGGAEEPFLRPLEEMARKCQENVQKRWKELAGVVYDWLTRHVQGGNSWQKIWQRQQEKMPIYTTWSAVEWARLENINNVASLRERALPCQDPSFRQSSNIEVAMDRENIAKRRHRLAPWVNKESWARYEWAREVHAYTNLAYHQMERGFDYALTHHQLLQRHALRKNATPYVLHLEEGGEKCTLCGQRQALSNGSASGVDGLRRQARQFWKIAILDPDQTGAERLCAICTMKRFLVEAGNDKINKKLTALNPSWAGPSSDYNAIVDSGDEVRVPFPSTATLAAQNFLIKVVTTKELEPKLARVVALFKELNLPRTNFPRALFRLSAAQLQTSNIGNAFLMIDTQLSLFPEAIEGRRQKQGTTDEEKIKYNLLKQAVKDLRSEASKLDIADPSTRLAVIRMDGDAISRLLLGEADRVGARWRDVLHPEAVRQIEQHPHLLQAGWGDLLDAPRLIGPSLHAFISRALAEFSHRIVPWVVEREFSGRLVYAGGDDVLCLAPADEAIDLAARLQQLFSAPWLIDTQPTNQPWDWRLKGYSKPYFWEKDEQVDRSRFIIPKMEGDIPIHLPIKNIHLLEPHVLGADAGGFVGSVPIDGHLLPMLGGFQSLSAGIAIGHFKTSLSVLLRESEVLLKDLAKGTSGRRSLAVGHASRNGVKTRFVMPWSERGQPPSAHQLIRTVIKEFRENNLPGRLPYKLREFNLFIQTLWREVEKKTGQDPGQFSETLWEEHFGPLLRGGLNKALDGKRPQALEEVYILWKRGICSYAAAGNLERAVDGLLLCRNLASKSGEEEE
ncbi:MAG: type III-B CRISPR-associated protein Cas10/Cmr2 [Magnetococcus sp. DMHC-6]